MKRIFTILSSFLLMASGAFAQKKLTEATISYDIVINTGSQRPRAADFFDGATSTVYLKGLKSRTEMVSSLGTQATLIDLGAKSVAVLKEYGPQKYIIQMTPANWKDANRKFEDVQFSYMDDTKTILGYKCKKAIGKLSDGTTFTVWYTLDLVPENNDFQYVNRSLPGLAMEYESNMGKDLKVTYTVSKINMSPVPAAKFDLPKAGFRVLSYDESKGQ
ncbi:MAG: hypothetical protein JWP69_1943 [Flaviaesturariibacter sp.]|nr:hypothetical protein [Flaviaesturariibacter sp.]